MKLDRYLKEIFGENIVLEMCHTVKGIPIFLEKNFDFYKAIIQNTELTFLVCKNENYNFRELEKHINLLSNYITHPVLVVQHIRKEKRNWLIQHRIAFLDINRQMYIPYLGLQIEEVNTYIPSRSYFSKTAQLTFIYLLIQKKERITVKELSTILSTSLMTASRVLRELLSFHLIVEIGANTRKHYQCIPWQEFFVIGEQYLVDPVLKSYSVKELPKDIPLYLSNESGLSYQSMLNNPKNKTYAISLENQKYLNQSSIIKPELVDLIDCFTIEVWKYNPGILTSTKCVDIISLYAQLKDCDDSRVRSELKNVLKEIEICKE